MKKLLGIMLLLLAVPALAQAQCAGHACGADQYCSGPLTQGIFCLAVEEGGVRTCGNYSCSGGGGGGSHEVPLMYEQPREEGAPAAKPRTIDKFVGMTFEEAFAACSVTPGCTMNVGDQVLMRRAPTWGALKIRYR